ncbi:MAG TPA: mandelate racemase/muconate lactonizing enzyme family protein [Terriglobia bacterium]|jgi:D-arabinonate dehydratase|nr:mandelate racemase/muconate lactonizing enzyme family protein [Terriglobia bacterium]
MKIVDVRAIPLVRPLAETFRGGTYQITSRNTLITEIETDTGLIGSAFGGDEEKYQNDVVAVIESVFKPLLIGEEAEDVERLWDKMFRADPGLENRGIHTLDLNNKAIQMQAIAAVDIALWDLLGKHHGVPLYKLLGGFRDCVPVIAIGGYYADGKGDKELIEEMKGYRAAGLAGVKMKVGRAAVEEDVRRVRIVREALGRDFVIACDANQAWVPEDAIRFGRGVEDLGIRWLEEPVVWYEQLRGLRRLRQAVHIPVVAGQGEISRFGCRDLIVNEAVDILNVDVTIAGGITEWRRIAGMASTFGVGMAHHEEPQVAIHLLASIPHGLYVEIFQNPDRDPVWFELPLQQPEIRGGSMRVPKGPGLGIDLNPEIIARYSGRSVVH